MGIKEMHYDIKKKLNKVDSRQYRNLLVPEIDFAINEAIEIFIKMAHPRIPSPIGFEKSVRSIEDIRPLVESEHDDENQFDVIDNKAVLPENYMFYVSSYVNVSKGPCTADIDVTFTEHDDKPQSNPFYKSSFEWRRVNAEFNSKGVRFLNDGSFQINKFCLSYIRKPKYVHNAENYRESGYMLPSGTLLTGHENCELPDHVHREITDIAVMLLSGEMNLPGYQAAVAKLKLNQLN